MNTRTGHSFAFGLIAAMAVIMYSLLIYLAGVMNNGLQWLSYPIAIAIFCVGVKKWRDTKGGYLSYGQTYVHLLFQVISYSVLMTIWTILFFSVIAPDLMEQQMLIAQAKMEEDGMSQAQIDIAMEWSRKMTTPPMLATFSLIGNVLINGIICLIVAAIMKKDPPVSMHLGGDIYPNVPPQNFPPQQ